MQFAMLFPGQGSQSVGMLADLADSHSLVSETFSEASEVLGFDLWQLCQSGPEDQLNQTEHTQPAMLAAGIACWRVWQAHDGAQPDLMAGHSLGEYAALVAAGSVAFADAIGLVALRGRLMQQASPDGVGAMAAILGMDDKALEDVCAQAAQGEIVSCANFNSPGQVVIAGHRSAVERASDLAKQSGARRAVLLPVSVPSHCLLMKPAADQLELAMREIEFAKPSVTVIHNANVQASDSADDIRDVLARQLWQPVRWTDSIASMSQQGVGKFVECGPGKVLAGLNRRNARDAETGTIADSQSLQAALEITT